MSFIETSPVLVILGAMVVSRFHLRRIRKKREEMLTKFDATNDESAKNIEIHKWIDNMYNLAEIQEQNNLDYVLLVILSLIVLFKTYM